MHWFLVIVTNYYNSEHLVLVLFISGIFHIYTTYYSIQNILELFIEYDKNKDTFLIGHNILSAIPIVCDVCLIFLNSPTEISIPFLLINIMMGLLFVVKPFYKLTDIVFYSLWIAQNYYIGLSNKK
jgi:hypothetical protein